MKRSSLLPTGQIIKQLKTKNNMKTQIEKIRSAENQIKMFEMINDLAIEINKTYI